MTARLSLPLAILALSSALAAPLGSHVEGQHAHAAGHHEHAAGHHGKHHGGHHHRFGDVRWSLQAFEGASRDAWQKPDRVVSLLGLQPGQVAVDIGSSTGYFTRRLAQMVGVHGRAIGLDVEPSMVAYLNQRARREQLPQLSSRLAAPNDPGLALYSVDCVLIVDTLHHIEPRSAYLAKLHQALRPGGVLAIVDFRTDCEVPVGPPLAMRIAPDAVVSDLRKAGFGHVECLKELPYQYVILAR